MKKLDLFELKSFKLKVHCNQPFYPLKLIFDHQNDIQYLNVFKLNALK